MRFLHENIQGLANLPAAFLTTAALAGASAWAVRGRASSAFAANHWHGPRSLPNVALTFDDGPSLGTPKLLRILAEYQVPATFFQCGANIDALPEISREVAFAGHQIGNHTYSHHLLALKSPSFVADEFARGGDAILRAAGVTPTCLRVPFGVRWFGLRRAAVPNIMWDIIGRDWVLSGKEIAARVLSRARNGSIICLHDGRELNRAASIENTIEAVRWVVPALLERGLAFRTVDELLWTPKS